MSIEIDSLVLGGGSIKGVSMIGSLCILEEKGILQNIKRYAGTSAGGILCTMLNLGYTPNEINDTLFSQNESLVIDNFLKIPYNLFCNYGLFSATKIVIFFQTLFQKKGYSSDTTFNELYLKTDKILVMTGTSLNARDTYYFNYKTFPDMKVIDALRITMSIPLFFTSISYPIKEGLGPLEPIEIIHRFVDGGLLQNFPLYYFDVCDSIGTYVKTYGELSNTKFVSSFNNRCIGIMLMSEDEKRDIYDYFNSNDNINNIIDYTKSFINCVLTKIEEANFRNPLTGNDNYFSRTITIKIPDNISSLNFNMDQNTKKSLIEIGKKSTEEFFKNNEESN